MNDVFVMNAWGKDQQVGEDVVMLSDGNGAFAKAVGLEMDASGFGMGARSQRYSMIAENGVVKQLNIEAPRRVQGERRRTTCSASSRPCGGALTPDTPLRSARLRNAGGVEEADAPALAVMHERRRLEP